MTIDTQEALRVFDEFCKASAELRGADAYVARLKLRAMLSAKEGEPSAANWEQALDEWRSMKFTYAEIAARAYALRDAEKEKGNAG